MQMSGVASIPKLRERSNDQKDAASSTRIIIVSALSHAPLVGIW